MVYRISLGIEFKSLTRYACPIKVPGDNKIYILKNNNSAKEYASISTENGSQLTNNSLTQVTGNTISFIDHIMTKGRVEYKGKSLDNSPTDH